MANSEDVLADAELIMDKMERDGWRLTPFRALAAEVSELRRDRARLDWLLKNGFVVLNRNSIFPAQTQHRYDIDAAMGGGEGEA